MSTYFLMGKYSVEALKEVSANRTDKAIKLINQLNGKVISMYALLGDYDLVLIVDLPNIESAMKASLGLSLMSGISFSTLPAVTVDDFDRIIGEKKNK